MCCKNRNRTTSRCGRRRYVPNQEPTTEYVVRPRSSLLKSVILGYFEAKEARKAGRTMGYQVGAETIKGSLENQEVRYLTAQNKQEEAKKGALEGGMREEKKVEEPPSYSVVEKL